MDLTSVAICLNITLIIVSGGLVAYINTRRAKNEYTSFRRRVISILGTIIFLLAIASMLLR